MRPKISEGDPEIQRPPLVLNFFQGDPPLLPESIYCLTPVQVDEQSQPCDRGVPGGRHRLPAPGLWPAQVHDVDLWVGLAAVKDLAVAAGFREGQAHV